MKASIKGKVLHIEIPLNDTPKPSATGKTLMVATSGGNKVTECEVAGKKVVIGLNAYIPKD